MALYRLHRKDWDKTWRPAATALTVAGSKRKRAEKDVEHAEGAEDGEGEGSGATKPVEYPGGGRKGVSSGLSTVIKRGGARSAFGLKNERGGGEKEQWWKTLGGASSSGAKGSFRVKAR